MCVGAGGERPQPADRGFAAGHVRALPRQHCVERAEQQRADGDGGERERHDTNSGRVGRREEPLAALSAILGARSVAHWLELMTGAIPCAPLNSVADVFSDAQVQHNRTVIEAGEGSYCGVKIFHPFLPPHSRFSSSL